jgi:CHAD domain-containing protein
VSDATTPISIALARALTARAEVLVRTGRLALSGDPDAIHAARVASRRVRELLALADELWPDLDALSLGRQVRRLTRALGEARELDVAVSHLADPPAAWPLDAVGVVRRALERDRAALAPGLRAASSDIDLRKLAARTSALAQALEKLEGDRPVELRQVRARVASRAASLADAVSRCGTLYAIDRLHEVRIASKKLRYAIEAQRTVGAGGRLRDLARLKRMQSRLGALHDLQMLESHAARVLDRQDRAEPLPDLVAWVASLSRACREAHAAALPGLARLGGLARTLSAPRTRRAQPGRRMLRMAAQPVPRRRKPA